MQGPTNEAPVPTETVSNGSVPTETVSNGPNLNRTFTVRRRAAKRSEPWYRVPPPATPQSTAALPPPSPEDEDIPHAKKPRLQALTSFSTAADGVTTNSPDDTPTYSVTPAASLPSAAASRPPPRAWEPEEDAKLKKAVKKHGKDCWVTVAAMVSGRTHIQCRLRWTQTLDPANSRKGKWKSEEDAKLTEALKKHGKDCWVTVAAMVSGRTNGQCRERWVKFLDPANSHKGKWKSEEDAKLTEAVKKHGNHCWAVVAAMVSGRTNLQCRERWVKTVDTANRSKGKWSPEEDTKLKEAVKKHGKDCWVTVAAMVSGRTNIQCRERWVKILDPANGKNRGEPRRSWKPEEDTKLKEAVKKHGKECWVTVAAMVSGRSNIQCRERWTQTLDNVNKNKGKWSPEEDTKLTEAVKKHDNHWVEVAAMVSGRTNIQCRERWVNYLASDRASNTVEEE
jgi:hypothetical protein